MSHEAGHGQTREEYAAFHAQRFSVMRSLLERHLPAQVDRVLDVGSGADVADLAAWLAARYEAEVHTVDLGENVDQGQAKGLVAHPCNVDREALPFDDASLDLVLFTSIIEHLYNPHFVLSEVTRVLRPGGRLLFEAPNAVALGRRWRALRGHNPFAQFNVYNAAQDKAYMEYCAVFYTADEAEELLIPNYTVLERAYAMHQPKTNPLKAVVRHIAAAINPNLSDAFALIARKT